MKVSDLGINIRTGYHDKRLTPKESRFVGILWEDHVGEANKLEADALAFRFLKGEILSPGKIFPFKTPTTYIDARTQKRLEIDEDYAYRMVSQSWLERAKREVRYMHNHLLRDHAHIPILSKAGNEGGYWIAESEAEAAEFYSTFRKRGLTGLVKASRGKQAAMVDMVRQLSFEFEDLVDQTGLTPLIKPRGGRPMPVEIVDAFLERMTRNPEQFADGLAKIGEKYGSVLLPRERVRAIQRKVAEFQAMVNSLGQ